MQKTPLFHVILVEPKYEINLGAVARVIANFEMGSLILVNPKADLLAESTRRFAMHAQNILDDAKITSSLEESLASMDLVIGTTAHLGGDRNIRRIAVPPEDIIPICKHKGDIALIFGREDSGLTNAELDYCDMVVTIPAVSNYSTLNLVNAVAIVLYVLYRAWTPFSPKKYRLGSRLEKQIAFNAFIEIIDRLNYPDYKYKIVKTLFKNLLGRSYITGRELHTLIGFLRRINSFSD